jgi:hemolysin activation/secretion protein
MLQAVTYVFAYCIRLLVASPRFLVNSSILLMSSYRAFSLSTSSAVVLVLLGLLQTSSWAQTNPSDPVTEIRRQQEREEQARKRLETAPQIKPEAPAAADTERLPAPEAPCHKIDTILIDSSDGRNWSWLLGSLDGVAGDDSPMNRCLGAKSINLILKRGQNALVAKGLITSRLLAQQQDLKTGKLTLSLVLGRIGAIRFADPKSSHPSSTNALPASVGDVLNLRDIEQALENFKRVPTAEADIKIEPGKLPGESDLVIEWKQSKSVRYSLGLDDSGSDTTGKRQASATVSVDNPLGLSDLFYLTLNHDAGGGKGLSPKGTQGVTLHYSVPMGYWNVSTTASNTSYKQTVEGANENYLYSGKSANAEVKLSRIVYRDATNKTTLAAKLYRKGSQNFIEDTEVEVQRRITSGVELSAAHRLYWGNSTIEGQLTYKQGLKLFGALPAPEEEFDEGTSQFKIISLDASISTPFKVGEQKFKFDSSVKVQRNKTPLIAQDRFSIGSRYTVRGFDGKASLAAEKGVLLQNTIAWTIPKIGAEAYIGVDYGHVSGPSTENLVGTSLIGTVLGIRGSYEGLSYDIFAGRPVRKPGELEVGKVFGFNLNYGF